MSVLCMCFRPSDADSHMMATVPSAAPQQLAGSNSNKVVPLVPQEHKGMDPAKRALLLATQKSGSWRSQTGSSAPTPSQPPPQQQQQQHSKPARSMSGKPAEYEDPQTPTGSKRGLLLGVLGRGALGSGSLKVQGSLKMDGGVEGLDQGPGSRRLSDDAGDSARQEIRIKTKEQIRTHLKTQQPKRSCLKKDTPVESVSTTLANAAEGDDEALLKLAHAMAASAPSTPLGRGPGAPSMFAAGSRRGSAAGSRRGSTTDAGGAGETETHDFEDDASGTDRKYSYRAVEDVEDDDDAPDSMASPAGSVASSRHGSPFAAAAAGPGGGGPQSPAQRASASLGRCSSLPRHLGAGPGSPHGSVSGGGGGGIIAPPTSRFANASASGQLGPSSPPTRASYSGGGSTRAAPLPPRPSMLATSSSAAFGGSLTSPGGHVGYEPPHASPGGGPGARGSLTECGSPAPSPTAHTLAMHHHLLRRPASERGLGSEREPAPAGCASMRERQPEPPGSPGALPLHHGAPSPLQNTFLANRLSDAGAARSRPALAASPRMGSPAANLLDASSRNSSPGPSRHSSVVGGTARDREEFIRSLPPGKSPVWYAHKLREAFGPSEEERRRAHGSSSEEEDSEEDSAEDSEGDSAQDEAEAAQVRQAASRFRQGSGAVMDQRSHAVRYRTGSTAPGELASSRSLDGSIASAARGLQPGMPRSPLSVNVDLGATGLDDPHAPLPGSPSRFAPSAARPPQLPAAATSPGGAAPSRSPLAPAHLQLRRMATEGGAGGGSSSMPVSPRTTVPAGVAPAAEPGLLPAATSAPSPAPGVVWRVNDAAAGQADELRDEADFERAISAMMKPHLKQPAPAEPSALELLAEADRMLSGGGA